MRRWIRRHRAAAGVIAIAVLLGGAYVFYRTLFAAADETPVQYVTQAAENGTLVVSVSGTGNMITGQTYDVVPEVSGVVTDLSVTLGDTVTEGQVLFVLDNDQLDMDVLSAETSYKQAQASLLSAQANETLAEQSLDDLYDAAEGGGSGSTNPSTYPSTTQPPTTQLPTTAPPTTRPPTTTTTCPATSTTCLPTSTTAPPTTDHPTTTSGPPTTQGPTTTTPDPPTTDPAETVRLALVRPAAPVTPVSAKTVDGSRTAVRLAANTGGGSTATATTVQVAQAASTPTDADIDAAEKKLEAAQLSTEVAENNLEMAEYNLQQAQAAAAARTVTAPSDGVVTALSVSEGQEFGTGGSAGGSSAGGSQGGAAGATGGSSGGTSSAMTISNPDSVSAQVSLNEVDIPQVAVDQKATLTVDALPDLTMAGKVTVVDPVGTVSQGVVTFNVTIVPDVPDDQVRPGMTAAATIITEVAQDVLMVPSSAVKSSSDGGSYVEVLVDGAPQQVSVEVGLTDGSSTEITSGLQQGQEVVVQTTGGSSTETTASQQRNGGFGIPGGDGGPQGGGVIFGPGGPGG